MQIPRLLLEYDFVSALALSASHANVRISIYSELEMQKYVRNLLKMHFNLSDDLI